MSLRTSIAAWDCKSIAFIRDAYEQYASMRGFLSRLVSLTQEPDLQCGTTWMIKHHFDEGGSSLTEELAEKLYAISPKLAHWESRLHMLQCMPHIPVPARSVRQVERFVSGCLTEETKFVRAWAYSGYRDLAVAHPRFRKLAQELLEDALETETAGSVLARVRILLKAGF